MFVFGCVWLRLVVLVRVVFVLLLVASVLALMRWLMCGGDDAKKTKTKSVITKKNLARNFVPLRFEFIQKIDPQQITNITVFENWKNKSATRISVVIFMTMALSPTPVVSMEVRHIPSSSLRSVNSSATSRTTATRKSVVNFGFTTCLDSCSFLNHQLSPLHGCLP